MIFKQNSYYKTRCGHRVLVVGVIPAELKTPKTVLGAIELSPEHWDNTSWRSDGKFIYSGEHDFDLVEELPEIT